MCRILGVAPNGHYEWLEQPLSNRAQEDARLLRLIRASFVASHCIYGALRVFLDLREAGETCSKHRVARLMRLIFGAPHGYRVRRWAVGPSVLIPNLLSGKLPATRQSGRVMRLAGVDPIANEAREHQEAGPPPARTAAPCSSTVVPPRSMNGVQS